MLISTVRLGALVAATALSGLALSACGTKTVDTDDLQSQIGKQLSTQAGLKAADVTVKCPDDQEVAKGRTFDCDLKVKESGQNVKVKVTLTNDDGGYTATTD